MVDQGDKVIKGQKLVLLEDEDLRQQVEMAKAELAVAHASVDKTISGIKSAEATENQAKAFYASVVRHN
jgi:multidrug resistance efflux pump